MRESFGDEMSERTQSLYRGVDYNLIAKENATLLQLHEQMLRSVHGYALQANISAMRQWSCGRTEYNVPGTSASWMHVQAMAMQDLSSLAERAGLIVFLLTF